jgi:TolA-binding protein
VRLSLAKNEIDEAVKEAETLLRVNSESQYAPATLLLLAKAHVAQKKPKLARKALERVKADYPDSPLVKRAEEEIVNLSKKPPAKKKPGKKRGSRKRKKK